MNMDMNSINENGTNEKEIIEKEIIEKEIIEKETNEKEIIEKETNEKGGNEKETNNPDKESNYTDIDKILEKEKQQNKADTWNKLDKTVKIQKLHTFAEKYGKDNTLPMKDIKALKYFFNESLEKNKLQKTKDVVYEKDKGILQSIPSLSFNIESRSFALKINDKRISTLKSLTPHRIASIVNSKV
jgi:hypothetical protein